MRKIGLAMLFLALACMSAFAADVNGKWTSEIKTNDSLLKYTYEFHADGAKLTGKAISDHGNVDIQDGKIDGDTISFVEVLHKDTTEIKITYTGKVEGNEIKFTRLVGGQIKEELVAKRAQ
jgi:hypothetical protein